MGFPIKNKFEILPYSFFHIFNNPHYIKFYLLLYGKRKKMLLIIKQLGFFITVVIVVNQTKNNSCGTTLRETSSPQRYCKTGGKFYLCAEVFFILLNLSHRLIHSNVIYVSRFL